MNPRPAVRARDAASEQHHSAGGLVVRDGEVLLIATAGGRRWQLPKGHVEPGEIRRAGGGARGPRGDRRRRPDRWLRCRGIDYSFVESGGRRIRKRVDYYLLDYVDGDVADFDREEVRDARWFDWDEALSRLSHRQRTPGRRGARGELEPSRPKRGERR